MSEMTNDKAVPNWDEIEKRVIESFNIDDVGTSYGVSRWKEHVDKARGTEDSGEIAHHISSPMVLDAVVEFFKSDIEKNEAIFRVKVARNERLLKLMNLRVTLGEAQGVFVDEEDGEHVVPELLAVVRVTKAKMLKQVVHASMTLANNNGDENAEQPSWPAGVSEDFSNDLTEFINANGDQGREMVTRVCEDTVFAKKVCNDEEYPKPIRFLAQVIVEANSNNNLPGQERRIGFGIGDHIAARKEVKRRSICQKIVEAEDM